MAFLMHLTHRVCWFTLVLSIPFAWMRTSYGQDIGLGSFRDSVLFTDARDHWASLCIEGIGSEGLMRGYPDKSFRPNGTMTRAEFAAVMIQAFPDVPRIRSAPNFVDVSSSFWGKTAIALAYEKGFLSGYPNNTFRPAQPISRAQAMIVIANAQQLAPPANSDAILQQYFNDAQAIPNYAKAMTAAATERGLIVNYPTVSELRPNANITRGEATALLCRLNAAGTDARYFVPDRYVANFGSTLKDNVGETRFALPTSTILHEITSGIYGLLHTHAKLNDELNFFIGDSLWTSDSSVAGTQRLHQLSELETGLTPRNPRVVSVSDKRFWFTAGAVVENNSSDRLYSSDGNADGTIAIASLHPDLPALFNSTEDLLLASETVGNEQLIFVVNGESGDELWTTDGESAAGTRRLATFNQVARTSTRKLIYGQVLEPLPVSDDYVYFQAVSAESEPSQVPGVDPGPNLELWRSDGTERGTVALGVIADTINSTKTRSISPNRIYTQTANGNRGWELWSSDGTPNGTRSLTDPPIEKPFIQPGLLTTLGDRFFFLTNVSSGLELRAIQNGATRHESVKQLSSLSQAQDNPWSLSDRGKLFFNARVLGQDEAGLNNIANFRSADELWVTEGNAASTRKLATVEVSPESFTWFNGRWFFSGTDESGNELWTTDGTPEGTYQLLDLLPGVDYVPAVCPPPPPELDTPDYCPPVAIPRSARVRSLTVHEDFLYFIADDSDLFRTDGNGQNIQHVQNFTSGPVFRDFPANLAKVNDTLFVMGYGDGKILLWAQSE
ncbi:MAG: S-layer homology domain-containing protein [Cyanobacteria bacterium J06632_3]